MIPQMGLLAALTFTFGKEVQDVGGKPCTRCTTDFEPTATTLKVHTTLGFHSTGMLWLLPLGIMVAYTGKTDKTFTGVTAYRPLTLPRGSYVLSATNKILPPAYELFWPNSQAAAEFYGISLDTFTDTV